MTGDEQNLPNTSQVDMTEPSNLGAEDSVMHGAEAVNDTEDGTSSGQGSPHDAGPEDQPSSDNETVSEAAPEADAAAGMTTAEQQAVIQQLEQEIVAIKAQVDERNSLYVRLQADFDNFRKRTQKEKEELETQIKCSTIVELLPVIDNFDRARSQLKPQTEEGNNIHKSYQGVYKQLVDCLKRIGVSPMRSEGKDFDPNLHEAVIREPTDQHAEGVVIEELVRGYLLGDKVLRHAMVKVATVPEDGANDES